ncbi:unnamed protein product [Didymodactylos carnosus]|uniref:Uncharacterized protein n=1 Tax=Didymodactylos carnosus TaxID=1234261 RepID=A0A815EIJ8_9BILA|nr:unnamed protein product [Didymodactylos carnosus]CAF1310877.1 unnamed protein product [Didymodactylos carnosus]CAF4088627.1 unnamed protein product [Didymodactylos carnosus]CAF4148150.1 unnamed protein product [Didymodactylos carnosus]
MVSTSELQYEMDTRLGEADMDLSRRQFIDDDMSILGDELRINKYWHGLHLVENNNSDRGVKYLARGSYSNARLKVLDLDGNQISDECVKEIAHILPIARNSITDRSINVICNILKCNHTWKNLYICDDRQLSRKSVQQIEDAAEENHCCMIYI